MSKLKDLEGNMNKSLNEDLKCKQLNKIMKRIQDMEVEFNKEIE